MLAFVCSFVPSPSETLAGYNYILFRTRLSHNRSGKLSKRFFHSIRPLRSHGFGFQLDAVCFANGNEMKLKQQKYTQWHLLSLMIALQIIDSTIESSSRLRNASYLHSRLPFEIYWLWNPLKLLYNRSAEIQTIFWYVFFYLCFWFL